jgi:hypothetical protein
LKGVIRLVLVEATVLTVYFLPADRDCIAAMENGAQKQIDIPGNGYEEIVNDSLPDTARPP